MRRMRAMARNESPDVPQVPRKMFATTPDRTDKVLKDLVRPVRVVIQQLSPSSWPKGRCGRGSATAETENRALIEKFVVWIQEGQCCPLEGIMATVRPEERRRERLCVGQVACVAAALRSREVVGGD